MAGALLSALLFPPLGTLISLGVWIWSAVDAYRIAKHTEIGFAPPGGRVIDASRFKLPHVDLRAVLPYVAIPAGIALFVAVTAGAFLVQRGFKSQPGSDKNPEGVVEMIRNYHQEKGAYPKSIEALINPSDPMEMKKILDSWGRPFLYQAWADGFRLSSAGKDGQPGTEDDIAYRPGGEKGRMAR